jgi:hypothetical protein
MHALLLAAILVVGSLGFVRRIPSNVATWIVGTLTVLGVFTSPDMTTRLTFVVFAIIGPLLPYPLALVWSLTIRPLLHYFQYRTDAQRTQFALAPDDPRYEQAGKQLDEPVREAIALGFRSHGRVALQTGTMTIVNEFLERDNGRVWAFVCAVLSDSPPPLTLHCSTRLATGEYLVVSNYSYVDPNPPVPGYVNWRLASVTRIADMVRACEAIAARSGPVIPVPLDADVLTRAKRRTKLWLEAEREAGYQRYDAAADVYRPTLKGAYRYFWISLPPLNGVLDRRDRERERALLAELELAPAARPDRSPGSAEAGAGRAKRRHYLEAAAWVLVIFAVALFGPEMLAALSGGRYDPSLPTVSVPASLTVPESFPDAVRTLEQIVGQPSHQLSGTVDDSPAPTRGVAISMHRDSADAFVVAAQDAFLARGFYLFRTGERFSGIDTDGLALYPTRDPYEIMRAMDTNGANHGLSVEDVIAWFRREEAQYPIRFGAIAFDYVGGRVLGDLPDVTGFASRFIQFCPDLKGESVTVRWLARDMQRTRQIYCWWD